MSFLDQTKQGMASQCELLLPDAIWAGNAENDSKKIIATVKMDQDADGKYDIEAYVDAEKTCCLKRRTKAQKYPYSVKYDNAGSIKGCKEEYCLWKLYLD